MLRILKNYYLVILVILLLITNIAIFYLGWQRSTPKLTFAMLNVGQGDALFVQSPTGTQVLIDAGPPRRILGELHKVMPWFDKSLDAVIITNPDLDHIGGLEDVLKIYKVGTVLEPGTFNSSTAYQNLQSNLEAREISNILAKEGMRLDLGGGAVIDILFPDRDVSLWATNEGSIIAKLTFGETSIMLTGDSTSQTEKIILEEYDSVELKSDILKVGHHGSYSSTSRAFMEEVAPAYALISLGENNKYGHPHQDVLDTITSSGAKVLRTDLLGTIIMHSDGVKETFSFHK